jgi:hypothetical protein
MHDRRLPAALVAVAAIAFGLVPASAAGLVLQPGTYGQLNPATHKVMNPGNQIVLVRGKTGRLSFSVNAIRALDLNQGFVAGTLPANGPSVTWMQKAEGMNCKLTFAAEPTGLEVTQDLTFGDCGFGYGVDAGGIYVKTGGSTKLGAAPGP